MNSQNKLYFYFIIKLSSSKNLPTITPSPTATYMKQLDATTTAFLDELVEGTRDCNEQNHLLSFTIGTYEKK